jgi:starch synthase (maltosyl-transferring)
VAIDGSVNAAAAASTVAGSHFTPRIGRIPIRNVSPVQPEDRWPAKAFVGEVVPFGATVFREGHDLIGVDLLLVDPDGRQTEHRMSPGLPGTDRWEVLVKLSEIGAWRFRVQAYSDDWASWLHNAEIKVPLGQDVELVFAEGLVLLGRAGTSKAVTAAVEALADSTLTPDARLAAAHEPKLTAGILSRPLSSLETVSEQHTIRVERARAGVGSWYEFFPRSVGAKKNADGTWKSGTFKTAATRLPAVAAMGFDVVYLPPIHPIGVSFRKGPNNSLDASPTDPGSPWAIGGAAGGHDAIHPDLGTVADFTAFLRTAGRNGLEVAIDLALQCSPDHPWVKEHPEWFTTLPDGSIAYAENPPKKYQDIYPLNFDNDPVGIREEILRIVNYWIDLGIHIFRVDNPHTKPLDFWEWLIAEVNGEHPEVVFLAEAFTRPALMQSLAGVGFQQSYSYFTWRNTKAELEEFLVQISDEWSAPTWGVYSGFELYEDVARAGSEENVDNEKYEYRPRDYAKAEKLGVSLAPYLTELNRIRAEHPALRQLRNLDLHWSDDDSILVYSKFLDGRFIDGGQSDGLIIVANVDPHSVRETMVHLDASRFGLALGDAFDVVDLLSGQRFTWGEHNYVRLDAFVQPVHILSIAYRHVDNRKAP